MLWNVQQAKQLRAVQRRWLAVGWLCAATGLLGGAEAFLLAFPPADLHPYLGDAAPLSGVFVPDSEIGVGYQSLSALVADNPKTLGKRPLTLHQPCSDWVLFGSSFVHMEGALADELRKNLPDQPIVTLDRKETLTVRMAQARTLLESDYRPARLVMVLMPIDVEELGRQPIETLQVSASGALTYKPALPPAPFDGAVASSRLALIAWARTGRHQGDPHFSRSRLYKGVPDHLKEDLRRSFGVLAKQAKVNGTSMTVVLIPVHRQVADGAKFGFQDAVAPLLAELGIEVVDPRTAFLAARDKEKLYLDDGHLAPAGNRIVREELTRQWNRGSTP